MNSIALTIAGSDPSGGAGLQADIRTFQEIGVFGTSVVALLTVQNSIKVYDVQVCEADFVSSQIRALLEDLPPQAIKTGALGSAANIAAIVELSRSWQAPLVVDPVMLSSSGAVLLDPDAQQLLINELLPRTLLVTPNIAEAERISGIAIQSIEDMKQAARQIAARGPENVLITGGHLCDQNSSTVSDVLFAAGELQVLSEDRSAVSAGEVHGTGCVLSAAVTAYLALGEPLPQAVRYAKQFTTQAITRSRALGSGSAVMTLK